MSTELATVEISEMLNNVFQELIDELTPQINPYFCEPNVAFALAVAAYDYISANRESADCAQILELVEEASSGKCLLPIWFKNGAHEPAGSLLSPASNRGFDYGGLATDRLKQYFYTEWFSWVIAVLLNHDNAVHPVEHGGGKRFHLISPIPSGDDKLRDVGASTGGGEFQQHNDATIYNDIESIAALQQQLSSMGTSLDIVASKLSRSVEAVS